MASTGTEPSTSAPDPTSAMTEIVDSGGTTEDPDDSGSTTASSASCDEDPAACTAWILTPGSGQWVAEALDVDSTLAPTEPVRAAFDVESELEGIIVTDTRLHVVDLASRLWIRSENRSEALPELGDDEILVAYSIPSYWGEMFGGSPGVEGVLLVSASTAYSYDYDIDAQSFTFVESTTDFGAAWDGPAAPSRTAMQAAWLDVSNAEGWAQGDIMQLCGVAGEIGPYAAFLADGSVYLQDTGYCFEFFDPVPHAAFEPFELPGAPGSTEAGAAFYNETLGLWILRGV